jgi:hypothetical protein
MEPGETTTSPALLARQILVMAAVVVLEALVLRLALQAVPAS